MVARRRKYPGEPSLTWSEQTGIIHAMVPSPDSIVGRLTHRLTRIVGSALLLALPIGYYHENPDSTDLMIGVHGGTGQLVSVLRGCSGQVISSNKNTFHDYSGSIYLPAPPSSRFPIVLGLRAGSFDSEARFATRSSIPTVVPARKSFEYINPNISLEYQKVGVGVGIMFGDIPGTFDDFVRDPSERIPVSFHLRLGDIETGHVMISLMENTPLISGGSIFDLGIGYKVSPHFCGYTGLSAGMYDHMGFLQQGRIRLFRELDLDLAFRLGSSAGHFEGSVSGGILINLGRSAARSRPKPPKERSVWDLYHLDD